MDTLSQKYNERYAVADSTGSASASKCPVPNQLPTEENQPGLGATIREMNARQPKNRDVDRKRKWRSKLPEIFNRNKAKLEELFAPIDYKKFHVIKARKEELLKDIHMLKANTEIVQLWKGNLVEWRISEMGHCWLR